MKAKTPSQTAKTKLLDPTLNSRSLAFWPLLLVLILYFFISPFSRALFNGIQPTFNGPIYSFAIWLALGLLVLAIHLLRGWKASRSTVWAEGGMWLLVLTYLLSFLIQPASRSYALNSLLILLFCAALFLITLYFAGNEIGRQSLSALLFISGAVIVIFGFMNWFGDASMWGMIHYSNPGNPRVYTNGVLVSSDGSRLTSVFQYGNSYAAYLIGLVLAAIYILVTAKHRIVPVWLLGLLQVPILISLLLTLSRGGLVILPIVLLILLPFLPIAKQIAYLLHLVMAAVLALLVFSRISHIGLSLQQNFTPQANLHGWLLLIGASVISAVASFAIQWWLDPVLTRAFGSFSGKVVSRFIFPILAIVVGGLLLFVLFSDTGLSHLLPKYVKTRIQNINIQQNSVLERGTFYKDSFKIIKDYPVFGAGGGGWAALYEKYQHNPYVSRQTHSFFLQYWIETGTVGILILLAFLVGIYTRYIRSYIRQSEEQRSRYFVYFIFVTALLAHSIIDFDMSYVYLEGLLFLGLGAMLAGSEGRELAWGWLQRFGRSGWRWSYPAVVAIVAVVFFSVSLRLLTGVHAYNAAVTDYNSPNHRVLSDIMGNLNKAIAIQAVPDYVDLKVKVLEQVYQQTKDKQYLQQAQTALNLLKTREPYSHQYVDNQYDLDMLQNNLPAAHAMTQLALQDYPWEIGEYERAIGLDFSLGLQAGGSDKARQKMDWDEAMGLYQEVLARIDQLKLLPKAQEQGQPFDVTPTIAVTIGQIDYYRGEYAKAVAVLKPVTGGQLTASANPPAGSTPPDVNLNRGIDRWYLAALMKQGKQDNGLYQQLIAADPTEKDKVNQLLAISGSGQ